MPRTLSVGPVTLDGHLVVYILAIIVGYFIIKLRLRQGGHDDKSIMELVFNCIIIVVLFWKFGTLLFNPSIMWHKPWQILMLVGTWKQVALGVGVAFIYAIYKLKRMNVSFLLFIDALAYGLLTAAICKSVLIWEYGAPTSLPWGINLGNPNYHYHPLNVYKLLLSALLLIWFCRSSYAIGKGKVMQDFLIYYGLGLLIISLFENTAGGHVLFSGERLVHLGMIVLGLIFPHIIRKVQ